MEGLASKTIIELKSIAQGFKIDGRSKMNKVQLIEAILIAAEKNYTSDEEED